MIVKFFKYGTNNGKSAFKYLLNYREEEGTSKLLRGSPALTLSIIRGIKYKQKYKSGCLSFEESPEDISTETKEKIMDEFERVIFPGIEEENRNIAWIEHSDKGRLELNFVIPRVVFTKNRQHAFNPYFHQTDKKRMSLFRDYINSKYNFSNPNEISKRQTLKIGDLCKYPKNEHILKLNEHISSMIDKGFIQDREGVIKEMEALGYEIRRRGANYISIQSPSMSKAIRLKGVYYEEHFNKDDNKTTKETPNEMSLNAIVSKLKRELSKASKYYKEKFKLNKPSRVNREAVKRHNKAPTPQMHMDE